MITDIQLKALLQKLKEAVNIIEAELEVSDGEQIDMGLEKSGLDLGNGESKTGTFMVLPEESSEQDPEPDIPELESGYTRVEFDSILNETDKAYQMDFGDLELWMPKSKIKLHKNGEKNLVDIDDWLYKIKFPDG